MGSITAELSTLRALTFRLSSTATSQLPQQVPAIAASLANCKLLLSSTQASTSKTSTEASVAIHKYRTLLSTLLQDRTIQGRWCAIVLIKATIEAGGWETLQKSLPWVRGLLGVLTKPDPNSSKKLCLITLTRIFVLTREYPTLVREITTPSLPAYIQACLQIANARPSAGLLQAIFESFGQLLPRHPTVFRSYLKQLQQLVGAAIAQTPSNKLSREQLPTTNVDVSSEVSEAARRLYVQLPCCTPKGAANEEWAKSLDNVVSNVHRTADKIFRAVIEDWQSVRGSASSMNGQTLDDQVQDLEQDAMGLDPWLGIFAGSERLLGLLRLIKEYLLSPTSASVSFPFGLITDLVTRILSLTVPSTGRSKSHQLSLRFNNQVGKEERDSLWTVLPQIHVATMEMLLALAYRIDESSAADSIILDQLIRVFGCEKDNMEVRTACYLVAAQLLARSGATLPKSSVDPLAEMIRACCGDILPPQVALTTPKPTLGQHKAGANSQQQTSTNADAFLVSPLASKGQSSISSGLRQAAHELLSVLLGYIPAQHISDSLRARMDRAAILAQHKNAMVASVMNPLPNKSFGKPTASILPLLARSFAHTSEVESFVRPRMPVVRFRGRDNDEEDESMDIEEENIEDQAVIEDEEHFAGEELDSLLETAGQSAYVSTMPNAPEAAESSRINTPVTYEIPHTESVDAAMLTESSQALGLPKRPSEDQQPSSPKRVKVSMTESEAVAVPAAVPTKFVVPLSRSESFQMGTTDPATIESTVLVPTPIEAAAAAPTLATGDSDDDDFGELVLGQDTDEDSEA